MRIKRARTLKAVRKTLEARASGPITLYVNKRLYERFKAQCKREGLSASPVVEQMMSEFIESKGVR